MTTGDPTDEVLLELRDGIAHLTLNRPEQGNAFNLDLVQALRKHAESLRDRDDVRVVVVSGSGTRFCVGGDLTYVAEAEGSGEAMLALVTNLHAALEALTQLDAPLICAVQGAAAGAGLSLTCAADFAIGTASSKYVMAYTAAGLSPDGGSSWYLPRVVGWRLATEMMITNRVLSAQEAQKHGILNDVVEDEELQSAAETLASRLAAGPTRAYGTVKTLLSETTTRTLAEQLEAEGAAISAHAAAAHGQEGMQAFLQKRKPDFTRAR